MWTEERALSTDEVAKDFTSLVICLKVGMAAGSKLSVLNLMKRGHFSLNIIFRGKSELMSRLEKQGFVVEHLSSSKFIIGLDKFSFLYFPLCIFIHI